MPCRDGGAVHTERVHRMELRRSNARLSLPSVTGLWHTQLVSPLWQTYLTGSSGNNSLLAKNKIVTQNVICSVPSNDLGKTVSGPFVCLSKGDAVNRLPPQL